jgi:hypothetical protein
MTREEVEALLTECEIGPYSDVRVPRLAAALRYEVSISDALSLGSKRGAEVIGHLMNERNALRLQVAGADDLVTEIERSRAAAWDERDALRAEVERLRELEDAARCVKRTVLFGEVIPSDATDIFGPALGGLLQSLQALDKLRAEAK